MDNKDREAIAVVYKIMKDAGQPVSRLEITRAIKQKRVIDLGRTLELMLKEKIIVAQKSETATNTVVFRYDLAKDFDLEKWQSAG